METEKELDLTRSLQPRFLYFALKMSCLEGRESRVHNWFAVSKLLSLFTEAAGQLFPHTLPSRTESLTREMRPTRRRQSGETESASGWHLRAFLAQGRHFHRNRFSRYLWSACCASASLWELQGIQKEI